MNSSTSNSSSRSAVARSISASNAGADNEPPLASTSAISLPPPQDDLGPVIKRTRTGCLICRRRHVKCDERKKSGTCTNCARIGATCIWEQPYAPGNGARGASKPTAARPRPRKACAQCRDVKAKCGKEKPSCSRCAKKGLPCGYSHDREQSLSRVESDPPSPPVESFFYESQLGDKATLTTLLDAYFTYYYPSAYHSFLHRTSITRDFDRDALDPELLKSMCIVAVRLTKPESSAPASWWNPDDVVQKLASRPTLDAVHTGIHLTSFAMWQGLYTQFWMLTGMLSRAVYALRLNLEPDDRLPFTERESRRRTAFAVFVLDGYCAGGVDEFQTFPTKSLHHIQLPTTERNFNLNIPCTTPRLTLSVEGRIEATPLAHNVGLLGHYITIMAIRRRILQYVVNIAQDPSPPWQPDSRFDLCRTDILVWKIGLGSEYEFNKENIHARQATGQLNQLFALRIFGHQATVNLCRIAIHGFREAATPETLLAAPPTWLLGTQSECFTAAVHVLETGRNVLAEFPDFFCRDSSTSAALFESCRIQIWALFNLVDEASRQAALVEAVPRIEAAVLLISRASAIATGNGVLQMLARLLRNSPFAFLAPTLDSSSSGRSTPSGDYPTLLAPSKHELITRVHGELAEVKKQRETAELDPTPNTQSVLPPAAVVGAPLPDSVQEDEPAPLSGLDALGEAGEASSWFAVGQGLPDGAFWFEQEPMDWFCVPEGMMSWPEL